MRRTAESFRIGKVQGYLRGSVWYLCYHEQGKRQRPRVGEDVTAARQMAAQINSQLENNIPAALSFQPITIVELRRRWLEHHEMILRSSVQTVNRYRTATEHLVRFLMQRPVRNTSLFHISHAEEFVGYLRRLKVSPNGHSNTTPRPLMDKGLKYILECCRALFTFALKRRHLSPYAENPFAELELNRIPIEVHRPIHLFTSEQESNFLDGCDRWQFPIFLTLMLTGLRSGELCHLLLPDNLDLEQGILHVRNKPRLMWQVKTRNERSIPLHPVLVDVLSLHLAGRKVGPVFTRRKYDLERLPAFAQHQELMEVELERSIKSRMADQKELGRLGKRQMAQSLWQSMGTIEEDVIRRQFMRRTTQMGLPSYSSPKMLRHLFATALQKGRVDPLIRNELMGHVLSGSRSAGHGLAMTAVYTHTQPETKREQLFAALDACPAVAMGRQWADGQKGEPKTGR
ncbi:MAG: tyrosine-type recombinase/integrase [Planctomycetia bacterium]|nr:tyrosine-type recombinase/integrase [Planctomycetia bacterium]